MWFMQLPLVLFSIFESHFIVKNNGNCFLSDIITQIEQEKNWTLTAQKSKVILYYKSVTLKMQFILQVLYTYTVICIHYFKFAEID